MAECTHRPDCKVHTGRDMPYHGDGGQVAEEPTTEAAGPHGPGCHCDSLGYKVAEGTNVEKLDMFIKSALDLLGRTNETIHGDDGKVTVEQLAEMAADFAALSEVCYQNSRWVVAIARDHVRQQILDKTNKANLN